MAETIETLVINTKNRFNVLIYWDIRKQTIEDAKREIGYGAYEACRKVLKVHEPKMDYTFDISLPKGKYNIPTEPGRNYRVELGVLCETDKEVVGENLKPTFRDKIPVFFKIIASAKYKAPFTDHKK
jgi:hypothetical protein